MKREDNPEEQVKTKAIKILPTETAELCKFLEGDDKSFSYFVRQAVKKELKKYRSSHA